MMSKLLPCPFCGSEPWGIFGPHLELGSFWVECHGADANKPLNDDLCGDWHFVAETKEEVAVAWNKRTEVTRLAALTAANAELSSQVDHLEDTLDRAQQRARKMLNKRDELADQMETMRQALKAASPIIRTEVSRLEQMISLLRDRRQMVAGHVITLLEAAIAARDMVAAVLSPALTPQPVGQADDPLTALWSRVRAFVDDGEGRFIHLADLERLITEMRRGMSLDDGGMSPTAARALACAILAAVDEAERLAIGDTE